MALKKAQQTQLVDAAHYSYLQALYLALFHRPLYVDVVKRWRKLALGYLLVLLAVVCLPASVLTLIKLNAFYQQKIIQPFERIPTLLIQAGHVKLDKPMPYLIKNDLNQVVGIVDTTNKITTINNKYPHLVVLINQRQISIKLPMPNLLGITTPGQAAEVNTHTFSPELNQLFNGQEWLDNSHLILPKILIGGVIYPGMITILWTFYVLLIAAFALMVQVIAKVVMKYQLTYLQAFRLLMVSATLHIILTLSCVLLDIHFKWLGWVLLASWAFYLSLGLIAVKQSSHKMVRF
ncbi:MAG: hypothetical protein CMF38_06370 [Legionellaceae bacterium]|nr:hypothetical protein [Legionellaceae bacterium]HAF87109.1 hypothetical protein [Legionellales bacterium]HCA89465.1 hypothetical protein [Legionellales bacterium]|tara:strand:+ start:11607 stop:12482 length:876 start_codon:yes stop_codon:yes gene_type:complete